MLLRMGAAGGTKRAAIAAMSNGVGSGGLRPRLVTLSTPTLLLAVLVCYTMLSLLLSPSSRGLGQPPRKAPVRGDDRNFMRRAHVHAGASHASTHRAPAGGDPPRPRPPPSPATTAWDLLAGLPAVPSPNATPAQAWALCSLLFQHLLACPEASPATPRSNSTGSSDSLGGGSCKPVANLHELRHPQAPPLLGLLRRLLAAHAPAAAAGLQQRQQQQRQQPPRAATGAPSTSLPLPVVQGRTGDARALPDGHCSTAAGAALLQQTVEAVRTLAAASCGQSNFSRERWQSYPTVEVAGAAGSHGDDDSVMMSLPFVTLRRLTMAVLQLLRGQEDETCGRAVTQAAAPIFRAFADAFNCSRSARPAIELLHISKAGGTSMCQMAAKSGLFNPNSNMDKNCLYPWFRDDPKWSRLEPGLMARVGSRHVALWPAVDCTQQAWLYERRMGCDFRSRQLSKTGVNFYSNELALHEGDGALGSARACPQLETMIMLREPVERTRSHIIELDKVYALFVKHGSQYQRSRDLYQWQSWAPALLDNYMTRSLLGRHFMHCRDFGTVKEPELLAASLVLASLDHILLLEQPELNDVVLGAGLGWQQSMEDTHWRWSRRHDLHKDLGFPADAMSLLAAWNTLDAALYHWGGTLLALDAAFHTGVAALTGRVQRSPRCKGEDVGSAAAAAGGEGGGRGGKGGADASDKEEAIRASLQEAHDVEQALEIAGLKDAAPRLAGLEEPKPSPAFVNSNSGGGGGGTSGRTWGRSDGGGAGTGGGGSSGATSAAAALGVGGGGGSGTRRMAVQDSSKQGVVSNAPGLHVQLVKGYVNLNVSSSDGGGLEFNEALLPFELPFTATTAAASPAAAALVAGGGAAAGRGAGEAVGAGGTGGASSGAGGQMGGTLAEPGGGGALAGNSGASHAALETGEAGAVGAAGTPTGAVDGGSRTQQPPSPPLPPPHGVGRAGCVGRGANGDGPSVLLFRLPLYTPTYRNPKAASQIGRQPGSRILVTNAAALALAQRNLQKKQRERLQLGKGDGGSGGGSSSGGGGGGGGNSQLADTPLVAWMIKRSMEPNRVPQAQLLKELQEIQQREMERLAAQGSAVVAGQGGGEVGQGGGEVGQGAGKAGQVTGEAGQVKAEAGPDGAGGNRAAGKGIAGVGETVAGKGGG